MFIWTAFKHVKALVWAGRKSSYSLRSNIGILLESPKGKMLSTLGARLLPAATPHLCDSLPFTIRSIKSFNLFKKSVKTHLFKLVYHLWQWDIITFYYMATIVRELWLAAERAFFSCNDRALWNFSSARRLFRVVSKTTCAWVKATEKMDKSTTIFSVTERKTSIQILL